MFSTIWLNQMINTLKLYAIVYRNYTSMKILYVLIVISVSFIACNSGEDESMAKQEEQKVQSPELLTVTLEERFQTIPLSGRIKADNRLMIFPEIQGKILPFEKAFREGTAYQKGETILNFDSEEIRLQLQSSKSRFKTLVAQVLPDIKMDFPDSFPNLNAWYSSLHPEKAVPDLPDINDPQLRQFLSSRGIFDNYYQTKSAESKLQKFTIAAPFTGTLSMAQAEAGQVVGPQFHLGTLVDPASFILEASVDRQEIARIETGSSIDVFDQNRSSTWSAVIERINPSLDPKTQMVSIYLSVEGDDLREGMYLEGALPSKEGSFLARIPRSALSRTGEVYVVENDAIKQRPVEVMNIENVHIWVSGLRNGDRIVVNAKPAYSGLKLQHAGS